MKTKKTVFVNPRLKDDEVDNITVFNDLLKAIEYCNQSDEKIDIDLGNTEIKLSENYEKK